MNAFDQIFSDEVLARLSRGSPRSPGLEFRLAVIEGQNSGCDMKRDLWTAWIECARSSGLFDRVQGAELIARLTSANDDNFRSALSEYMACYFLVEDLGLRVVPRPFGRNKRVLEFRFDCDSDAILYFEVKSPRSEKSFAAQRSGRAVLSQNLNPDILMIQPTQNCDACDGAELLRAPKVRRILVQ